MTIDAPQTLELLQTTLLRRLGAEVDLIFRYGSSLRGNTHAYSDLDISYVPVHEATWDNITVLVDDTLIDLYPIHWSQLERMAEFENVSCTVLFEHQIVYQRSDAEAARLARLKTRMLELQQPEAHPEMLKKAQNWFQQLGYPYYLLREQADRGNQLACLRHARQLLQGVAHCLAICNQTPADTRKLAQILALPKLPAGFAATVNAITSSTDPAALVTACDTLMRSTRALLLAEQNQVRSGSVGFPEVFEAAYPELKNDLQHLKLACERRDRFNFNLLSLYHELMIHTAQALTGIEYSDFNSLADYEQDLAALGFPDLLAYAVEQDYDGLLQQCDRFDQRLQEFLTERHVPLYAFETLDDLRAHLE